MEGLASLSRDHAIRSVGPIQAALLALAVVGAQCAFGAVPLEVYGRLPQLEDVALSPSGERAALIQTDGNRRFIAIESLTEGKVLKVIATGEQKLRYIRWADDDHLMVVTSMTVVPEGLEGRRGEWQTMQVYNLARGTAEIVPTLSSSRLGPQVRHMNVVDGYVQVRRIGGHTVLFVPGLYADDSSLLPGLFRVDLQAGETTLMIKGKATAQDWLIDQLGHVAARLDYDSQHQQWQVGIRKGDKWVDSVISGQETIDVPQLLGFTSDLSAIMMRFVDHGSTIWRALDLQQGKLGEALPLQGATPLLERATDRVLGVTFADSRSDRFFDPQYQAHWEAIGRAYAGEQVYLTSISDDFHNAIVSVEGARDGYAYEIIDLNAKRAFPVGDIYQGLSLPLPVKAVEYPAADGLKIPAYLTLPAGRDAKGLPLVVLPHGGPAAHDDGGFDWWSQALASRGYAVLQPNFRGSNLGWEFMSAGFGQVGRKMQTDLSDGVSYLVAQGIVDPKRVCIVGASYGGYAALAGISLFHGIYRCAVSVAGMSDLSRMMKFDDANESGESSWTTRYWDRFLGVHGADDPALDAISPIKHVQTVDVPVLLIHGTDDTVVAFEQSRAMFKALTALHKPAEFVTLNHEDHWLSHSETRLQMLQATVEFLRRQNPPD